jgi:hypothetical protein
MSGYIGTQPVPQATQTRDSFTCTAGQTSFATSGYTPNFLDVYLNGVKLTATDYTASNGSDVVLASGAATGDVLEVVAFTTFDVVTDTITAAGTALTLDRTGSDGTILDLKKDGSTVGSIQSRAGVVSTIVLDPRSGGGGLTGGGAALYPTDNAGSPNNGYLTLGDASSRFKDLYLSGGVYLGGTGSANKLDDYEAGVFTVGFAGATVSAGNYTGFYTKIGQVVHWNYYSQASNISGASGFARLTGLPFTVLNNISAYQPIVTTHNTFFGGSTTAGVLGYQQIGSTEAYFITTGTLNPSTFVNGGSQYIMVSGTYITA